MDHWLEVTRTATSFATPIVVAVVGVLLLRRIESTKAEISRQSDFHRKWAEQFFDSCQDFLKAIERALCIMANMKNFSTDSQDVIASFDKDLSHQLMSIPELDLRIRRSVVFAPVAGQAVTKASRDCVALVNELTTSKQGDLSVIVSKMNEFNKAARDAHAEMLGLRA